MRFITMSAIKRRKSEIAVAGVLLSMGVAPATAQQPNCAPGSPCATTTIDGKQLPPPPQKFEGRVAHISLCLGNVGLATKLTTDNRQLTP
jgi:hypothetical protein